MSKAPSKEEIKEWIIKNSEKAAGNIVYINEKYDNFKLPIVLFSLLNYIVSAIAILYCVTQIFLNDNIWYLNIAVNILLIIFILIHLTNNRTLNQGIREILYFSEFLSEIQKGMGGEQVYDEVVSKHHCALSYIDTMTNKSENIRQFIRFHNGLPIIKALIFPLIITALSSYYYPQLFLFGVVFIILQIPSLYLSKQIYHFTKLLGLIVFDIEILKIDEEYSVFDDLSEDNE